MSLATIAWLGGDKGSDAWVFESWPLPATPDPDAAFIRQGKFSQTIGTPSTDRFYPSPYMHNAHLGPNIPQAFFDYVESELRKPRDQSIVISLSHFHRARFETPFFSLPVDDIETLWSGFEAYFHFPFPLPPNTSRDQHMLACFEKELQGKPLRVEFWDGLKKWIHAAYDVRCRHTHGSDVPDMDLALQSHDIYLLHAGLTLAESLMKLKAVSSDFYQEEVVERLNHLFIMRATIDGITSLLKVNRKSLYPGDGRFSPADFNSLRQLFEDLVSFRAIHLGNRGNDNKAIASARKKLGLVLSGWSKDLGNNPPAGVRVGDLASIGQVIQDAAEEKLDDDEVDKRLALYLIEAGLHDRDNIIESEEDAEIGGLMMGGVIPIWLVVDAFIRLEEIYLGYALR
ncbi:hypothetical protein F0U61_06945 [Archangium violaceum]|uniref:hypothetical protein n=1 Tax=Archangium violaceum TaxID=83451 RepID=UPI002B2BBF32|nr:hypothetical protein F0U61_06945 [Archangium violaceum]